MIETQNRISIVILNWNSAKDTLECIESLNKIKYEDYEIILVDNNSNNKDKELLNNLLNKDKLTLLINKVNLGFAGGNNVGIKYSLEAKADYILLLNNDTTVKPDFLEPLLKKFLDEKNIGIVAPMINYYDEPQRVWTVGGRISKIRGSGFADSNKLESKISYTDKEVDFVSGCCMLIHKDVLKRIGLFDENYFLYTEDTDFCYRVKKAGYKIYVTTQSKIFHKVNKSTKKNLPSLPLYYTTRNRLYFSRKNFRNYFPLTLFYISTTMLLKCIFWFVNGNPKNILTVVKAFNDFFSHKMYGVDHYTFLSVNNTK